MAETIPPFAVTCTAAAEEEDGSLRQLRAPSAARVLRKIRYRFILRGCVLAELAAHVHCDRIARGRPRSEFTAVSATDFFSALLASLAILAS